MKYTEAIEMILDGGMFYDSDKQYGYSFVFDDCMGGNMFKMKDIDVDGNWREPSLVPEDFITNDWIVEKDGVVYEKYTPSIKLGFSDKINIDVTLPDTIDAAPAIKFEFNNPATVTFHYSANLQEESKMQSQDEDWLEKKMICFMRRSRSWGTFAPSKKQESRFSESCADMECPSCFPNHIADVGDMVEQPREKVTVRDIEQLVFNYCDAFYVFRNCDSIMVTEKETLMRLAKHYLIREIEYLVSLQEESKMIMTIEHEKLMDKILDTRTGDDDTVRGFLQALLEKLLVEEEGFNGKRPFGDGGWKAMLIYDLAEAGLVNCKKNEDGEVYEVDEAQGELLLLQAIEYLFNKHSSEVIC